jgi:hypothetical protein
MLILASLDSLVLDVDDSEVFGVPSAFGPSQDANQDFTGIAGADFAQRNAGRDVFVGLTTRGTAGSYVAMTAGING